MTRCKGPTPKRGTRRAATNHSTVVPSTTGHHPGIDLRLDDLAVLVFACTVCHGAPAHWYTRVDVLDDRLVIVPTCHDHDETARVIACPDPASCTGLHAALDEDLVVQNLEAAFQRRLGIAFPRAAEPDVLDVIRPAQRP